MTSPYVFCADGKWRDASGKVLNGSPGPAPDPTPGVAKFAGHVPWRVLIGMNAPDDKANTATLPRPQFTEAAGFLGGNPGYIRRTFGTWISNAEATSLAAAADAANQYPVISFKVPSTRWDLVVSGFYDNDLVVLRNWAIARRASNKPVGAGIHHEPDGDGPIGNAAGADRIANLRLWADMQAHCVDFFTGWRTGVYNVAEDISDILAWTTIANGNWWGKRFPKADRIAAAYPGSLIAKMRRVNSPTRPGGGMMMADFYDANPPNGDRLNPGGWTGIEDRASVQMQGIVNWARANNVKAIGCGEFGCVNDYEFDNCWDVMRTNRDIWAGSTHFNNFTNSRWDWRMIPDSYPSLHPVNSKGLTDLGGTPITASYIPKFVAIRDASIAAANTGPF